ncbi:MAG: hypothetical protein KHX03_06680 [Clostridium sp.]|nr:hypothetical protein [Clostridium sp.]
MKIQSTNKSNNKITYQNFKAKDYAKVITMANGLKEELKIYEIEYADIIFLDKMSMNIKLKELLPEHISYTKQQLKTWKNIIDNSIMMSAFSSPEKAFLLTKSKRPCGIMSFQDNLNGTIYLDNLATWPFEKGKRAKMAGQTLMKILFMNAEEKEIKNIGLALPANLKEKSKAFYEKLHFRNASISNPNFDMEIFSGGYKNALDALEPLIKVNKSKNPPKVCLGQILNINY